MINIKLAFRSLKRRCRGNQFSLVFIHSIALNVYFGGFIHGTDSLDVGGYSGAAGRANVGFCRASSKGFVRYNQYNNNNNNNNNKQICIAP